MPTGKSRRHLGSVLHARSHRKSTIVLTACDAQVVFGGIQQVYEVVSRVVSSQGSLMAKQDRGHKLLGSAEAWKQVRFFLDVSARSAARPCSATVSCTVCSSSSVGVVRGAGGMLEMHTPCLPCAVLAQGTPEAW